jgi:DnaJ-class molecular chaperone
MCRDSLLHGNPYAHTSLIPRLTYFPHLQYVTLEEIYHGCVKKMKISRRVLEPDGTPKKEDKYVSIAVKQGWKHGTKVTFQKEGDQTKVTKC